MENKTSVICHRLKARMGLRFQIILWAFTFLAVLLPHQNVFAKKSYKMEDISIVANLSADGSMQVEENRTYRFRGNYRYAYRTFPLGSGIDYADFRVSENGQDYHLSSSQDPGTYTIESNDQEIEVRWYYQAKNEIRTFSVAYRVDNAVKKYLDGAVLYYKFIGEGFRKSTGNLSITVNPPASVEKWQVRQWAHGPLWGFSATSVDGIVTATCQSLPRKQFFELRVLYPAELFASAFENQNYVVDEIIAEETAWVDAANSHREKLQTDSIAHQERMVTGSRALPILLLLAVVWFVKIARQYGKRPEVLSIPSSSAEVPSDLPPAMVQYLITDRTVSGAAIMGTLLDLARRGFLEFREEQKLSKDILGREKWKPAHLWVLNKEFHRMHSSELVHFEEMLVEFVFEKLAKGRQESADEIIVPIKAFTKDKTKVQTFYGKWSREVKKEGERHNFFDQESFKGRNQGMMLGGALLLLAIPSIPLFHELALIPGVGGLLLILASLGIVHHNAKGRVEEKRWKSLKKHLTKQGFKSSEPASVLGSIESYFVYGVVFGMQKKHMAALGDMVPKENSILYMPWYHQNHDGSGNFGDSFGTSFSVAVASVNSAMASSSGAGGGATGGGGGGAGGGGGGAG